MNGEVLDTEKLKAILEKRIAEEERHLPSLLEGTPQELVRYKIGDRQFMDGRGHLAPARIQLLNELAAELGIDLG